MSNIIKNLLGVTYHNKKKAFYGYTLFAPMWGKNAWLINMEGKIVHRWKFNARPGNYCYLLPNGNLIYPERLPETKPLFAGGRGCDCLEVDWENNLVWKYSDKKQHHVVYRLRNGNTIFLRVIRLPKKMVSKIKGGIPGTEDKGGIYTDTLREISSSGEIIWEWKAYEHLDTNIFTICPLEVRSDWNHINSIDELPNGDLLLSNRSVDSLLIIDKKTGKVKWHWGKGILKHMHMATYLENGNVLCFDNGPHRQNCFMSYSKVIEVNPIKNKVVWEYYDKTPTSFYSEVISGAQRLPNGNTLITDGSKGRIFEVTGEKEVVWEYHSPFFHKTGQPCFPGWFNSIHRSYRYAPDFIGLDRKKLDPKRYQEFNLIYST